MTNLGKFVHYDLMTTDTGRARAFYTELLGWTVTEYDMGLGGMYQMLEANGRGFGGIVCLDPTAGAPSHWITYISTADLAACCSKAESLGGSVRVAPTLIPNVGTYAVLEDPQGGYFSPFQALDPNRDVPPPASGDGAIVWHELATSDPEGALAFYGALFGWSKGRTMAPSSDAGHAYHLIADQGKDVAGLMELPDPSIPRPYWLQYVQVADVAGTARRAVAMGGQTLHGPVDLADGHGRIAVVQDPTGAWIGIWQSASKG